ncbi:MAG: rhodanese-like domain-containing protein [Syntrophales bacterium]|nr:rhodanese-like domain-containing protein [Syntrophales bacterium]
MKKVVMILLALAVAQVAYGYDRQLAARFDAMFSQLTPEMITKRPCEINAKQLFDMIKKKEDFVVLDIRTPQEMEIVGVTLKNTLQIPMHVLFKEENLKKLPKDKMIVVVCHTGTRAAAAVIALRAVGFMNAWIFKNGIGELAKEAGRNVVDVLW